jgi:hypothetical protein
MKDYKEYEVVENGIEYTVREYHKTKTRKIIPPEGYRVVERIEGDIKIITFEKNEPKEVNLEELKKKIEEYRKEKGQSWYLNSDGEKVIYFDIVTYNNNTEEEIKAQELNLIFKGLVEMYSNVLNWNNENQQKWYMTYDYHTDSIEFHHTCTNKSQGTTYASCEDVLVQIVSEMGEENILKMLKNLK